MSTSDRNPFDVFHISGEYTTRRDNGIQYTYAGNWWVENYNVIWQIKVWEQGALQGELEGRFLTPPKDHIKAVVKGMIERSIESGAGLPPN